MEEKYDFKKQDNIRVIARFRPSSETEKREEKIQSLTDSEPKFLTTQEVRLKRPDNNQQQFKCVLDHIFKMSTQQKKIFDLVGRPMVQAVLEGYNATIFAYGQTGSGKTYTMFGPEKRKSELDLGLVQRCCVYLFDKLRKLTQGVSAEVVEWQCTASFIQIYKEHLSDLLEPSKRNLQIRTNFQTDTPYVENLKTVSINSIEEVLINLGVAFSNRIVASHKLNSTSSRSHMLLMFNVEQKTRDGAVKRSKLNFGDLAGSEDIRKALGDNPDPERQKEAIAINSSLTALTTAINNLSKGQRPSYRSSSLTHILQDSLGGNSKTTMIVNTSPHVLNRAESIRTLRFAMTAKTVKNKAKINKELTRAQLIRRIEELEAMNAKLKMRVMDLETQMQAAGLEVTLSTELYGDADGDNAYSSDDEDSTKPHGQGGARKVKKQPSVPKTGAKAKLSMDENGGVNQASTHQLDALKKEIDAANQREKRQSDRNVELEQQKLNLIKEVESMQTQLQSTRDTMEQQTISIATFNKERASLEARASEFEKALTALQAQYTKDTTDLDKQIGRQRNNIQMKSSENKELQKFVKELNLQNDELVKQNDLLQKQLMVLKTQAFKNNPELAASLPMDADTEALVQQLENYQLSEEEKQMEPADLLLHRFAAAEANDFRLNAEQRMKKTAKMMSDMSEDIGSLMAQWLPKNKKRPERKSNSTLVFQVRQLIGHFNVLVKQMKQNEESQQNDLKLDIKRRDAEIKKLQKDTQKVHQLQDDLQDKDELIEQLQKMRDDLQNERDMLKAQTAEHQDMIFDVQNQVRHLNQELERNRSTVVEMQKKNSSNNMQSTANVLDYVDKILDGEEPPSSSDEDDADADDDGSDSEQKPAPKRTSTKLPAPKKRQSGMQDDLQDKDELIEQLQKMRDDLQNERDMLKAQTAEHQDMIFDVQNQVRHLNQELERNRSTVVEMQKKNSQNNMQSTVNVLDLNKILDGEEPPSSSDDDDADADDDGSDSEQKPAPKRTSTKLPAPKKRQSGSQNSNSATPVAPKVIKPGNNLPISRHAPQESAEIIEFSDEDDGDDANEEEDVASLQHNGSMIVHEDIAKEVAAEVVDDDSKQNHTPQESAEIIEFSDEDDGDDANEEETVTDVASLQHNGSMIVHEDIAKEVAAEVVDDDSKQNHNNSVQNGNSGAKTKTTTAQQKQQQAPKVSRRKSTMSMWREGLRPEDQLDCKDKNGLWWTAKITGYHENNTDKLVIRFNGWGDDYDEVIDRASDRLAVFRSMFHSTDNSGSIVVKEGFMSKEGKMFKTWRKRWFILDEKGKLSYYHNQGDEHPIGFVDIKLMQKTQRINFGKNKEFGVQIVTDVRTWKFLCQSEKDLTEWIHAFNFVKTGTLKEDQ
eukprot:CAMPEP_0202726688 /NCGR_PEP_ID=MMETSP1385-20130828/184740_1 /ASSEMBLY_ACC=CAM_ASM_000861 /TAXON_ID=933848 /ORGANISM="Elphidium margaritaceum" /LENGTH=1381 /DNA_ID=CAMNT_0049392915 /DNA_START=63 /DNA_END=4208 /DNA_ORIENTATION=+